MNSEKIVYYCFIVTHWKCQYFFFYQNDVHMFMNNIYNIKNNIYNIKTTKIKET